jgi:hypothetical protein
MRSGARLPSLQTVDEEFGLDVGEEAVVRAIGMAWAGSLTTFG